LRKHEVKPEASPEPTVLEEFKVDGRNVIFNMASTIISSGLDVAADEIE
jgi:hypothetical protein